MLIQLLPSSTVAAGVRLKSGLGTVASEMPGGTWNPVPPNSGGMREPLQYSLTTAGLAALLCCAAARTRSGAVRNEYVGFKGDRRSVVSRPRVAADADIPVR